MHDRSICQWSSDVNNSCFPLGQLQYQAMGLYDSFDEDISSPSGNLTRVNVEELFDDPKYVSSTKIQVYSEFHPRVGNRVEASPINFLASPKTIESIMLTVQG